MKLVVQRVNSAAIHAGGDWVARIGNGALVFVGAARGDTLEDSRYLARKTAQLRIFDDEVGRLNMPIDREEGSFLVVSQFTLYGDCSKGNRPSYMEAADPEEGRVLYDEYIRSLQSLGYEVHTGRFQEHMHVELENDGPITLILESRGRTKT